MVSSMKLSRKMLMFGVLLVGLLAAVSELPEILTLTDNVSNDYISVKVRPDTLDQHSLKGPSRQAALAPMLSATVDSRRESAVWYSLASAAVHPSRDLVVLLATQRR